MIGGIGPGHDGLGLEHLERHAFARLGPDRPRHVILEGQLVDHEQAVAARVDLDRARVVALVHAHRPIQGHDADPRRRAERPTVASPHLHARAGQDHPNPGRPLGRQSLTGEVLDGERPRAQLHAARPVGQRDPDRPLRQRRTPRRADHGERTHESEPGGGRGMAAARAYFRFSRERIRVRTMERRMLVPRGK